MKHAHRKHQMGLFKTVEGQNKSSYYSYLDICHLTFEGSVPTTHIMKKHETGEVATIK